VQRIRDFLKTELRLTLHPNKVLLRSVQDGFPFLGGYIKPHRTYIGNRTKGSFLETVEKWNTLIRENNGKFTASEQDGFLSSINSYLGLIKQCSSYRLRKKILLNNFSAYFWNMFSISGGYSVVAKKRKKAR
jgi:hypothetical protein